MVQDFGSRYYYSTPYARYPIPYNPMPYILQRREADLDGDGVRLAEHGLAHRVQLLMQFRRGR